MSGSSDTLPHFRMTGIRAVLSSGPPLETVERQVHAIEEAVERMPAFAFDLAKALVETICKTILEDIGQPPGDRLDTPKVLREAAKALPAPLPEHEHSRDAQDSILKTLNGLQTAVQGLCELRKRFGLASHGRDNFSGQLGVHQAILAAQAADAIASYLYRVHRETVAKVPGTRLHHENYKNFNESFDRDYGPVKFGELELLASWVLFCTDQEAYKAALNEFIGRREDDDVFEEASTTEGAG